MTPARYRAGELLGGMIQKLADRTMGNKGRPFTYKSNGVPYVEETQPSFVRASGKTVYLGISKGYSKV